MVYRPLNCQQLQCLLEGLKLIRAFESALARSQHHCASKGRNATSQVHNAWAVWRSLFFFWVCGGGAPITLERASKQIASNSYYNHNCYDTLKLDRSLDAISLFFPATWRRDTRTTTHTHVHILIFMYIIVHPYLNAKTHKSTESNFPSLPLSLSVSLFKRSCRPASSRAALYTRRHSYLAHT